MSLYNICNQKLHYLRYAENTIRIYLFYIDEFEQNIKKHNSRIKASDIQEYINNYKFTSAPQQNQIISALKFAWEKGLNRKYLKVDFTRPRKEKRIPKVYDQHEIINRLSKIKNLKHKTILSLCFSVGLRRSEIINLKISDIDSNRMIIHIKQAKGKKDRDVPMSEYILKLLRSYYKQYHPRAYLFEGQKKEQYSATSCNKIFKAHIDQTGHIHLLRHSSLTAMLENGTSLRLIANIAGHKSTKTTEGYTHVSKTYLQSAILPL